MTAGPILFITSNRIGDAVLSSGVLGQLVEAMPDAPVTVACGALPAALFADLPNLERVHVIHRRKRAGHWLDLWRAAAGRRWAVAADLRGSLFPWTIRAGRRLVIHPQKRREHRVEELARQLRLPQLPAPRLWVSPARQAAAAARLGAGPVLAVGPTANWGGKQWPVERFARAAARLTAPGALLAGARVAIFGGPGEGEAVRPLLDSLPEERRLDFLGVDLLDAFALLRHCAFYLGNDSGLMHMAAAAGIPTLGLFGPSPEWRYGPWGKRCAVVRTPESFEDLTLNNPGFDHARGDCLMTGLTVDRVVAAAEALGSACLIR